MRKEYASELTREFLIKAGVKAVDYNTCKVFNNSDKEIIPTINSQGYLMIGLYDLDENGNKIKIPLTRQFKNCKKPIDTYVYKARVISLNRLIWAFKFGSVPAGYIVDHINNKHTEQKDYTLDNLQLLTPAENLRKEKGESTFMLRPAKGKDKAYYEAKLEKAYIEYDKAKKEHNADRVHKLRSNIANNRAKIRYIENYGVEF